MAQETERFGIVTQFGKDAPCRIERETIDASGRTVFRCRYYDADGYYNSAVDLFSDGVTEVSQRPAPLN